jgi:hypothetical protein
MSSQCGFSGNSDLCGLGIRLGVYLQWLTAGAAYALDLRHEASSVFEAYIIFAIAIMIALFTVTFTSQMHVIEIAVMLYLYFGGLMSVVYYIAYQNPTDRRIWRQYAIVISWFVTGGYSAWFWLTGRKSDHFVEDACGTTLFLFTRLGPSHLPALGKFFGSMSIIFGVLFGLYMMPLPPNFTAVQGKIYLDLERDAIVYDVQEYAYDLKWLDEKVPAIKNMINEEYKQRRSCFETDGTMQQVAHATKDQGQSSKQQGYAATKFIAYCLNAVAKVTKKVNRYLPGLDTLRGMYYGCCRYFEAWNQNREAQKSLPALSLLELNQLPLRNSEDKEW